MFKKIGILVFVATIFASMAVQSALACHTYTPGYWKNHPDDWPTDTVTLGGITYDKMDAIGILKTPPRGSAIIILQRYLIAAKLSVAAGDAEGIFGTLIDQADAWLLDPAEREAGISIAEQLGAILEQWATD